MPRSTVPARILDKMLSDAASNTLQCAQCAIGPVIEIPADETGCNWHVSMIQGGHCGDCLAAMRDFITGLRAEFLLETGEDMEPTLLTTWAMR